MKLKTLKDLFPKENIVSGRRMGKTWHTYLMIYVHSKIKKEAIKWVKELADRGRPDSAGDFTMFFDITEEDLNAK